MLRSIQPCGGFEGLAQQTRRWQGHVPGNGNSIAQVAEPGGTPRWRRAGRVADQLGQCTAQGLVKGFSTHRIDFPQPLLMTEDPAEGNRGLIGWIHSIPAALVLTKAIASVDLLGQALRFRSIVRPAAAHLRRKVVGMGVKVALGAAVGVQLF